MFFFLIFVLYPIGCFYIGWRFFHWAKSFIRPHGLMFWSLWAIVAATPLLSRRATLLGLDWLERAAIGNWILAFVYLSAILWLVSDLLHLVSKSWSAIPDKLKTIRCQGSIVTTLLICALSVGSWNAINPTVVRYELTINKHVPGLDHIKAVLVSDIHAGRIVGVNRIERLAAEISKLKPDIIFYAGDLIDDDADYADRNNLLSSLAMVKPRFGSYAVLGNHEYLGGQGAAAEAVLHKADMQVLRDDKILIKNLFYVVGRDDRSASRYRKAAPKTLSEIMSGANKALPIILLDHQPNRLQESADNGVDLQVSGHTHKGQFFPINLVVESMYEQARGYLRKDEMQLIVSSGYGTWGPPIRIGSRSEIAELTIHFKQARND